MHTLMLLSRLFYVPAVGHKHSEYSQVTAYEISHFIVLAKPLYFVHG
jgi:hypothetical protein